MIYRFRDAQKLLAYKELENSEIYFSPYDQLNDPMEGFLNVFWQGDTIAWIGLIKHFILMSQLTVTGFLMGIKISKLKY